MKRTSAIVLATGTVALLLAGCGGSSNDTADANGLRKGSSATSTASATKASSPAAAPSTPAAGKSDTAEPDTGASGAASKTTCGEFKTLDTDAEKALIEKILAENPDSKFAGSPNVALGTAKLVCLSGSSANTPVAVAAGIVAKDK